MKSFSLISGFIILSLNVFAQQSLTVQDAVNAGLQHNYSVKIASLQLEQARTNNTLGNAGFLPQVGITAGQTNSVNNTQQKFSTGTEINRDAAKSSNANASLSGTWTVFDGLQMFYSKNRLELLEKQTALEFKAQANITAFDVMDAYYTIVDLQNRVRALEEMIKLSEERKQSVTDRLEVGLASVYDTLQSSIDQNQDKSEIMSLNQLMLNASARLSDLTGIKEFVITDTVITATVLNTDELRKGIENNISVLNAESAIRIAELEQKEIKSERLPRLSLGAGYNLSQSATEAGLVLQNRNKGFNYGATISMPIFNGGDINRRSRNAGIQADIQRLTLEEIKERLMLDYEVASKSFTILIQQAELEKINVNSARLSNEILLEKFKIGTISSFEFRQSQLNYLDAQIRLSNALYKAKLAEISILLMLDKLSPNQ